MNFTDIKLIILISFFFLKYYIWHQERVLKNNNLLNWIKKKNYMLEISEIMIIDKIDS